MQGFFFFFFFFFFLKINSSCNVLELFSRDNNLLRHLSKNLSQ